MTYWSVLNIVLALLSVILISIDHFTHTWSIVLVTVSIASILFSGVHHLLDSEDHLLGRMEKYRVSKEFRRLSSLE